MPGCVAAVIAIVSPPQLSPAVIHRMSIYSMSEDIRVDALPGPICGFFDRRNAAPCCASSLVQSKAQKVRPDYPALEIPVWASRSENGPDR